MVFPVFPDLGKDVLQPEPYTEEEKLDGVRSRDQTRPKSPGGVLAAQAKPYWRFPA
jgi:hypothetical protein